MRYCSVCGAELEEGMRFCPQCGEKQPQAEETAPRDFWAERLQNPENQKTDAPDPRSEKQERKSPEGQKAHPESQPLAELRGRKRFGRRPGKLLAGAAILLLLAGILIFLVRKTPEKPVPAAAGTYYGVSCSLEEESLSAGGDWVRLEADGRAELCLLDSHLTGKWNLMGADLTIDCKDQLLKGTLRAGNLELQDSGIRFLLRKDGAGTVSGSQLPEIREYYGQWMLSNARGAWEPYEGMCFAMCGRLTPESVTRGTLELWDSDCGPGELICAAQVQPGEVPVLTGGRFYNGTLTAGDWEITLAEGLLRIKGDFPEPGDPESGFSYEILLKPWGELWEKPQPPGYHSWYEPLRKEEKTMPDIMEEAVGK